MENESTEPESKNESKAKGGRARANALTSEERSEIAKKAAVARWSSNYPQATHAGSLAFGDVEIPCYVLENGERILSTRGVMKSLGRRWRGRKYSGTQLPVFLEANNLKPFITEDLAPVLEARNFQTDRGVAGEGYKAEILPTVCEIYLSAREAGVLTGPQLLVAQQCEILVRAFSRVGIIALVDEATGYQYDRARTALQHILESFIDNELNKWIKTFPDEFYKQIARLKNYQLKDINKRGSVYAQLTNYLIYKRLAPGVLRELKRLTPKDAKGRRKHKYFQRLTEDIGHPALRELLSNQIVLMKIFPDGGWKRFDEAMNRAIPIYGDHPLFDALEIDDATTVLTNEPAQLSGRSLSVSEA